MGNPVNFYNRQGSISDDLYLLLHGNDTDGSTNIIDSSTYANSVSVFGNTQIDTAQSVFSGSSLLFDGTGDYLTVPDNARTWNVFGSLTDSWTVDFRVRIPSVAFSPILSVEGNADNYWFIIINNNGQVEVTSVGGGFFSLQTLVTAINEINANTWYHIAIVVINGLVQIYVNGTPKVTSQAGGSNTYGSLSTVTPLNTVSNALFIGDNQQSATLLSGWIDELAIRHYDYFEVGDITLLSNITVPAAEYDGTRQGEIPINFYSQYGVVATAATDTHTKLLLHGDRVFSNSTSIFDSSPFNHTYSTVVTSYYGTIVNVGTGVFGVTAGSRTFGGGIFLGDGSNKLQWASGDWNSGNYPDGNEELAIEAFIRFTGLTTASQRWFTWSNSPEEGGTSSNYIAVSFLLDTDADYKLHLFHFIHGIGTPLDSKHVITYSTDTFYHFAITRTNTAGTGQDAFRIWQNETSIGSDGTFFDNPPGNNFVLGERWTTTTATNIRTPFHGYIDEMRFSYGTNRLTASTSTAHPLGFYFAQPTAPYDPVDVEAAAKPINFYSMP